VFAVNVWSVLRGAVTNRVEKQHQPEALAFLEQAEDFYRAATGGVSANPLLLYYAFLNLAKVVIRARGYSGSLDRAMHGMSEQTTPGGTELADSQVVVKDREATVNVFPELIERLGYSRPANGDTYPLVELLPQVVVGHRIWRESQGSQKDRFVVIEDIEFVTNGSNQLWLRLFIDRGTLTRYGITFTRLLAEGGLAQSFVQARAPTGYDPGLVCFEGLQPITYTGRPTDVVAQTVQGIRPALWRIVTSTPATAYRRYYIHLSPAGDVRLPQFASLWSIFYYLGSVVRYRPHLYDQILTSSYGAFVYEFVSSQPEQLLYLLASEMAGREIARPAIV